MACKPVVFCTASILALSLASAAHAQHAATQGTATSGSSDANAEEIVVTGVGGPPRGAPNHPKGKKENEG